MANKYSMFFFNLLLTLVLMPGCLSNTLVENDNIQKLAVANNELAISLYKQSANSSSGNLLFSPLSIFISLGMLYKGARNNTQQELRRFLGYDKTGLSDELIQSTLHNLSMHFASTAHEEYVLWNANAVVIDSRLRMLPQFKTDLENQFLAKVVEADMERDADRTLRVINGWVESKTRGKIRGFLSNLDPKDHMILLNAVYFKGFWSTAFNPSSTRSANFYNEGRESTPRKVRMMFSTGQHTLYSTSDHQALELPYRGNATSMLILLPRRKAGLAGLEYDISALEITSILQKLRQKDVDVWLPKFHLESSMDLKDTLSDMGLESVFRGDLADFSGMVRQGGTVSSGVRHKAVVVVNEKGTEAAAATAILMRPISARPHFRADHPFLFCILDKRSGFILFMGRVTKL